MAVSELDIQEFCIAFLRRNSETAPEQITPDTSFAQLGVDSASSVHLLIELEDWAGVEIDPEAVFEHPTIAELASHVAALAAKQGQTS